MTAAPTDGELRPDNLGVCDRCGGEGFIEYNDGDGYDWGEDCPSEENHLITCRTCRGTGYLTTITERRAIIEAKRKPTA